MMNREVKLAVVDEFGRDITKIVKIVATTEGVVVENEFGANITSIVKIVRK